MFNDMLSFLTPITFSPSFTDFTRLQGIRFGWLEKIACKVDAYFNLFGKRLRIVKETASGTGVLCLEQFDVIGLKEKIFKVISYVLLLPLVIMLIIKTFLRGILHLKYGALHLVHKEELRDLLIFHNEEYYFSKLHSRVHRDIWLCHRDVRSGLTKEELEHKGINLVWDTELPEKAIVANLPAVVFKLKKYPGFVFSSFSGGSKEIANNLNAIRIMETPKIFDIQPAIRCQVIPPIGPIDFPYSLIVQGIFAW
ncbi:hypothetical protein cpL17_0006 [Chlamydia pecorum]|nr:hypothetical protein cpL17_0006 [Chlamydia pecorum]